MPPRPHRLPLGPLWRHVEREWRPTAAENTTKGIQCRVEFSTCHLADAVGVDRRTVKRWRHQGLMVTQADRAAVALGLHPASLWPVEWWAGVDEGAA